MDDLTLKLSAKDIYEKEFERTMVRGFKPEDVDGFLDEVIADYQKMGDLNQQLIKLMDENKKLKREVEDLRIRVATGRADTGGQHNNYDLLKRISNLEKAVFGK
ncbi:DivIVA domain-containing protein [Macrococcus equipercicus]|uniref:DivIVA domain-containing protein n=1 Tax=Macrococcus equipercicus TaxID=69967 RepID=A0A9Q9BJN4_9STAP|nr:DivIVA domain-containing protein [Macrococcus equipercicus]KAA1040213.1 DivIVA domain-containing protein [Macrococcus equipercicus]UTH12843.1 DivIVA domain-containing protein [Macrococcus equipercicus]